MSTAKVRVGVIGLGGMAGQHFRWLKQIADRAFVEAICDVDETLLARVGEEQNVSKKYRDFAAIIHDPDVRLHPFDRAEQISRPVLEMCMAAGNRA